MNFTFHTVRHMVNDKASATASQYKTFLIKKKKKENV